jgi:hypothetical protein
LKTAPKKSAKNSIFTPALENKREKALHSLSCPRRTFLVTKLASVPMTNKREERVFSQNNGQNLLSLDRYSLINLNAYLDQVEQGQ